MSTPQWDTGCPDWESRIVRRRSLIPFAPLFPQEAAAGLKVFGSLKVVDAPGSPLLGDVSRDWVLDFVAHIFGSYDAETGRRLITEYLLLISKKNGKSTDAAGIMMTALIRNWRLSAEFLILAPTKEIANNSFYPARDMVRHSPELARVMHVQDHLRMITNRKTGATLKIVAADSEAVSGKKATGVLIDELWLFGKRPDAENMIREATGGLASRPEGFTIYLSTQSDEAPAGVFKQRLEYARKVRDGHIKDKRMLPILYEFPDALLKTGAYKNKRNFYITNPNLGLSVDIEYLEREYDVAVEGGEASLLGFFSKHLNVQIGMALRSNSWAGASYWMAQEVEDVTLDQIIEECEVVDIGIDGGGLDDLLGLAVVGRSVRRPGKWLAWCRAWAHPSVLKRRQDIAARLKDFSDRGELELVERIGDDVTQVAAICLKVHKAGILDKIGVDVSGLGAILDALIEVGIPQEVVVGVSQGWKMHGAIKTTERKLAEGLLIVGVSELMRWCASNAKVVPQGNAIVITKQVSGTAKIDPLMALFNAITLISLNPKAPRPKYQLLFV